MSECEHVWLRRMPIDVCVMCGKSNLVGAARRLNRMTASRPTPFPPLWLVPLGLALSCAAWWMGHGAP